MGSKTVAEYLSVLPESQRTIAEALRTLILTQVPGAKESIKWSQPVYESDGPCIWIKAHKAHVTLGFWRGMQLETGRGIIEGSGSKMGHIKLRAMSELKPALLKALVQEAAALNRARGDPTKAA
jgi:hypothetical protein